MVVISLHFTSLVGLFFGHVDHRYVCYILAGGICNIKLCEKDMAGGIFLEKTPLFSVAVTKCFCLCQPLVGM
jgi:hypothetical protein